MSTVLLPPWESGGCGVRRTVGGGISRRRRAHRPRCSRHTALKWAIRCTGTSFADISPLQARCAGRSWRKDAFFGRAALLASDGDRGGCCEGCAVGHAVCCAPGCVLVRDGGWGSPRRERFSTLRVGIPGRGADRPEYPASKAPASMWRPRPCCRMSKWCVRRSLPWRADHRGGSGASGPSITVRPRIESAHDQRLSLQFTVMTIAVNPATDAQRESMLREWRVSAIPPTMVSIDMRGPWLLRAGNHMASSAESLGDRAALCAGGVRKRQSLPLGRRVHRVVSRRRQRHARLRRRGGGDSQACPTRCSSILRQLIAVNKRNLPGAGGEEGAVSAAVHLRLR